MPNRNQQDWQVQKYSDLRNQDKMHPSTLVAELRCKGRWYFEDSRSFVCMYPAAKGGQQSPQMEETECSTICQKLNILRGGGNRTGLVDIVNSKAVARQFQAYSIINTRQKGFNKRVRNHPAVWWFQYLSLVFHHTGHEFKSVSSIPGH